MRVVLAALIVLILALPGAGVASAAKATPTRTPTRTATATRTMTPTPTAVPPTATSTQTATSTATVTATATATNTPGNTATPTATATNTPAPVGTVGTLQGSRNVDELFLGLTEDSQLDGAQAYLASLYNASQVSANFTMADDVVDYFSLCVKPFSGELPPQCSDVVGLWVNEFGEYWFTFAEDGITCDRGSVAWTLANGASEGCMGATGDLVSPMSRTVVNIQTSGTTGNWFTYVSDTLGNLFLVSHFAGGDTTQVRYPSLSVEEGWIALFGPPDPLHEITVSGEAPEWWDQITQQYRVWKDSTIGNGNNYSTSASGAHANLNFCPGGYAFSNQAQNPPLWYVGTPNWPPGFPATCSGIMW